MTANFRTLPIPGNDTVIGTGVNDSLTVINNLPGGVVVQDFTAWGDGTHSGRFDAPGDNDVTFAGIGSLG